MRARHGLLALCLVALPACAHDNVALRTDAAFRVAAPRDLERVRLPMTVSWRAPGARAKGTLTGKGPFFAVFVDRAPIRAGTSLRSLIDDDCRHQRGCPDLDWYAQRFVFVTGGTSVTLPTLPAERGGTRTDADHTHRVSVVRIDGDGVRQDEHVASVEFSVVGA